MIYLEGSVAEALYDLMREYWPVEYAVSGAIPSAFDGILAGVELWE